VKKWLKGVLWGILIVAVAAGGVYSVTRPLQAELLEVSPRTIEKKFTESGTVLAVWQRDLYSLSGGRIQSITVREGDTVAAGEVLLVLDTNDIAYQIAQMQGELASLRGQERQLLSGSRETETEDLQPVIDLKNKLQNARDDYERALALYDAELMSRTDLDEAARGIRDLELLLAQQEQLLLGVKEQFSGAESSLRAQIALLEYQRANARFTAPEQATVAAVHAKEGDVVAAGLPLITLYHPGEYEVEVFLLAEDVLHVHPGMEVHVAFKGQSGDIEFDGEVSKIAQTAVERISSLGLVEQRVKVTVLLTGDVSGLRSGYAMDVTFVTRREENRLVVPKTALFTYEAGSALWVVREEKAEIQPVEKGMETDDETVIISGLRDGDLVIRNIRLEGLKEGVRITP
jgi:HlyD family secretion protein